MQLCYFADERVWPHIAYDGPWIKEAKPPPSAVAYQSLFLERGGAHDSAGRGARTRGRDVVERADVCVIGSGCGGASLAARLAEAGRSVVIVEQGGYYTKEDFDQRELNMLAKIDGGRGIHASDDVSVSLTYGNNVGVRACTTGLTATARRRTACSSGATCSGWKDTAKRRWHRISSRSSAT